MNYLEQLTDQARWRSADARELVAPFTGAVLTRIPQCTAQDIEFAFAEAKYAQAAWARRPVPERVALIRRFLDRVRKDRAQLWDILQIEAGKARIDACSDYGEAILSGSWCLRNAGRLLRPARHAGALPGLTAAAEIREPKGVIVIIAPWNAPIGVGGGDSIPALLAGNAVILKPDNQTALSTLFLQRAAIAAGIPSGIFQVVLGEPDEIGDTLLAGADYVAFTGSTATGRMIAGRVGERMIGCSLELGGKNPMIVLPDADLKRAACAVPRASFANAGQVCLTTERLYVHSSIFEQFLQLACRQTRAIRLGSALDFSCDMGALTTPAGFERTSDYVEQAKASGARVHAGGRARPDLGPSFYEPTILSEVTTAATLHTQEVFGPVVSAYSFDTVDEAIDLANATDYGLSASVWTSDAKQGVNLATRIAAGAVNINDAYVAAFASHAAPAGGIKASGLGRRHGDTGLHRFTEPKTIAVQRVVSPDNRFRLPRSVHGRLMGAAIGGLRYLAR